MAIATSGQAAALFFTDASWSVTATAPVSSDWSSNASFDTSGWQTATVLYDVGVAKGGVPGYSAKGIWSSGGQFSQTETQVWARNIFNLSSLPLLASLQNGFDDDGDLYINGALVVSDHNGSAGDSFVSDILPFLHVGANVIAFTATDNFPVWGFNHSAWVQLDGRLAQVPEPASLALLGLGLMGLASARRRNR